MRCVSLFLCLFGGLACSSGGSGRTCGAAKTGEACTVKDDCGCGLSCLDAKCATVYGTPGVGQPEPPEPTFKAGQTVTSICSKLAALNCPDKAGDSFDSADCLSGGAKVEAGAAAAGCKAEFEQAFNCLANLLPTTCPEDGSDPMEAAFDKGAGSCATSVDAMETCQKGSCSSEAIGCSGASPVDGPSGCGVSRSNDCQGTSKANCAPTEDEAGTRWHCTCDAASANPGKTFEVYAEHCCDVSDYLEAACGYSQKTEDTAAEDTGLPTPP